MQRLSEEWERDRAARSYYALDHSVKITRSPVRTRVEYRHLRLRLEASQRICVVRLKNPAPNSGKCLINATRDIVPPKARVVVIEQFCSPRCWLFSLPKFHTLLLFH